MIVQIVILEYSLLAVILEFMKTRSSGGEGKKVDLAYDIQCMRILDLPDDQADVDISNNSGIYQKIKEKQSGSLSEQAVAKIPQRIDADRLRNILKRAE